MSMVSLGARTLILSGVGTMCYSQYQDTCYMDKTLKEMPSLTIGDNCARIGAAFRMGFYTMLVTPLTAVPMILGDLGYRYCKKGDALSKSTSKLTDPLVNSRMFKTAFNVAGKALLPTIILSTSYNFYRQYNICNQ